MSNTCNDQSQSETQISPQPNVFLNEMNSETSTSKVNVNTSSSNDTLMNRRSPATYTEMMSSRRLQNTAETKGQTCNTVTHANYYGNAHSSTYDLTGVYTASTSQSSKSGGNYEYYDFADSPSTNSDNDYIRRDEQFDQSCSFSDCHERSSCSYQSCGNYHGSFLSGYSGSRKSHMRHNGNTKFGQGQSLGMNSRNHRAGLRRLAGYSSNSARSISVPSSLAIANENDVYVNTGNNTPIELLVTNLDFNIGPKEWKKILFMQFNNVIKSLQQVYMQTQQDGSSAAVVRVQTIEEARLLISHFHRKKIGYKRIQVNLLSPHNHGGGVSSQSKQEVVALLRSVTGGSLPVCKFMELFEKRYHRSISISDLYKMKDVVEIKEFNGSQSGRLIVLVVGSYPIVTPECETPEMDGLLESPVCLTHCMEGTQDYIEALDACLLPNVIIPLKTFKQHTHKLLQLHNGTMPLMSFPACYKSEFTPLNLIRDHGFGGSGVPLEHLITCVTGVRVLVSNSGVKKIQWEERKEDAGVSSPESPWTGNSGIRGGLGLSNPGCVNGNSLGDQMHQFSREVVDLIKHQTGCKILLSKFIPAYHHHFGKQCRVADYGFSKLHELVEALPHVVHVLGSGNLRVLTLSHKVQIRRFTNELTKVLKSTPSKSCRAVDIPHLYLRILGRPFEMTDYGVCFLEDMLDEIPDNTVEISVGQGNEMILSLPRRIQTIEEKEKTTQFALEVVDLLKQSPRCRLPFTKFIPSYHHHFSRQCRVSDYGFNKLVELLEAVPHVVKIVEEFGEKYVSLTRREHLRVLAEQTLSLLESANKKRILLRDFVNVYMKHQGHALNLDDFGVRSVRQLLQKIPRIVKLEFVNGEEFASLAERADIRLLAHKVLLVLLDLPCGSLSEAHFCEKYRCMYREEPELALIRGELSEIVHIAEDPAQPGSYRVKLRPLILFARDLRDLLRMNQGKLPMACFENAYEKQYGESLRPQAYGYPSTTTLLQAVDFVAVVRGRGVRSTILLCQEFLGKLSYKVAYSTEPLMDAADIEEERVSQNGNLGLFDHQPLPTCFYPQQFHPSASYETPTQMQVQPISVGPPPPGTGSYMLQTPQLVAAQPPSQRTMIPTADMATIQQPGSIYYATGQHDQRQLDELVERIAYESSPSPAPNVLPPGSGTAVLTPGASGGYDYASPPPPYVPPPPYHLAPTAPCPYFATSHPQASNGYWYESMTPATAQATVCPMLPYGPLQQQSTPQVLHIQQQRQLQQLMPVSTAPHQSVPPTLIGGAPQGCESGTGRSCLPKDLNDSMCSIEDSTPVKQMMVAMGMKTNEDNSAVDGNNNVTKSATHDPLPAEDSNASGGAVPKSNQSSPNVSNSSGAVYKLNAVNLPPAIYTQGGNLKTEVSSVTASTSQIDCMIAELKLESDGDNEHSPPHSSQSHDRPTFSSLRTN